MRKQRQYPSTYDVGASLYGFTWGPMRVVRAAKVGRYHVLLVQAEYNELEIAISQSGKIVRVTLRGPGITVTEVDPGRIIPWYSVK